MNIEEQSNVSNNTGAPLPELALKLRSLFFFLHDLDQAYEDGDEVARTLIDNFFKDRYGIDSPGENGLVPLLQAKTMIWFLLPLLSLLQKNSQLAGSGETAPCELQEETLRIMRNALAHYFDGTTTGVDLDKWTFTARGKKPTDPPLSVTFESAADFIHFVETVLKCVKDRAIGQIRGS